MSFISAPVGVVLAAGESRRFGAQKLVADLAGEPLLQHSIRCLLEGGATVVVVVTPPAEGQRILKERVPLFGDPRVRPIVNPDPALGMFSSVRYGIALAANEPIVLLPGDMPFVRAATVAAVLAEFARSREIVAPRFQGKRGHPLALPTWLSKAILRSGGETNLKDLLASHEDRRVYVDVDDPGILRDVDTPQDLKA